MNILIKGDTTMDNYNVTKIEDIQLDANKRGADIMILDKKFSSSVIIKKEKTADFFTRINNSVPKQTFWDECKIARNSVSNDDIITMNQLIRQRLNNGK